MELNSKRWLSGKQVLHLGPGRGLHLFVLAILWAVPGHSLLGRGWGGGGRDTKCIVPLSTSHLFLIKEAAQWPSLSWCSSGQQQVAVEQHLG